MNLTKAKLNLTLIVNYDSFIVKATVNTMVNYNRNTFVVQAIAFNLLTLFFFVTAAPESKLECLSL